jgi:hypothetical protein
LYNPYNYGTWSWTQGAGKTPWRTDSAYNPNKYPGVLDTLVAQKFRIHADCPTVYTGGCNTQ